MFEFKDIRAAADVLRLQDIKDIVVLQRLHPEMVSVNLDRIQIVLEPSKQSAKNITLYTTVRDSVGIPVQTTDTEIVDAYSTQAGMLGTRTMEALRRAISDVADEEMLDQFCERLKMLFQNIPNPTKYPPSSIEYNCLIDSAKKLSQDSEVGSWLDVSVKPEAEQNPVLLMVAYLPQGKPRVMITLTEVWGFDCNTLGVSLNWFSNDRAFEYFDIERWESYTSDEILLMICERVAAIIESSVSPTILNDVKKVLTAWSSLHVITSP